MINSLSRKLALCAVLTTATLNPLLAQPGAGSINFTWGDQYKLPKRHTDIAFIGNETDGYLQVGHALHRSLSLQKFDPQLHLVSEKAIDLDGMPRDYQNETFKTIGNENYWFFSTWENKTERLFAQKIDVKNGAMEGTAHEILQSSKLTGTLEVKGYFQYVTTGKWNFYSSFNKSMLLVEYRKKPESRDDSKNKDIIGFQVFDKNLNKVWGREIQMPYTEEKMDNEDYQVDGQGNVYTLAKVYENNKGGDKKKNRYRMEILEWSKDKEEVTIIPFRFTDKAVNSAKIVEGPNGELTVVGYYSRYQPKNNVGQFVPTPFFVNYEYSTDGVFVLKINPETNELNDVFKATYEFPASVLKSFESRRTQRKIDRKENKDKAEARFLEMTNVNIDADGSIQIFGEETYITETTVNTGRSSYTKIVYHYNDVLAMNIGADGNLKWVKKVPKSQTGTHGKGEMSFKVFTYNNNSYVFYMDNKKNLDLSTTKAPSEYKDRSAGVLMAVKIDQTGKMSRSKVFDVKKEKKNIIVTDFSTLNERQMIGRGFGRKKRSQPALINF